MNKDRVEGKVKDVAGRVERQAVEWTGDTEQQAHGAMKQAEGKVQNAWGKAKDAVKESADEAKARNAQKHADGSVEVEKEEEIRSRKAS